MQVHQFNCNCVITTEYNETSANYDTNRDAMPLIKFVEELSEHRSAHSNLNDIHLNRAPRKCACSRRALRIEKEMRPTREKKRRVFNDEIRK